MVYLIVIHEVISERCYPQPPPALFLTPFVIKLESRGLAFVLISWGAASIRCSHQDSI